MDLDVDKKKNSTWLVEDLDDLVASGSYHAREELS